MLLDRKRVAIVTKVMAGIIVFSMVGAYAIQWGAGLSSSSGSASTAKDAVTSAKERFADNSSDIDAAMDYAKGLQDKGDQAGALKVLDKAVKASPGTETLYTGRGYIFLSTNKAQQAAKQFIEAIRYNDSSHFAYIGLASAYEMMGQKNLAKNTLLQFIKENPKSSYRATMENEVKRLESDDS